MSNGQLHGADASIGDLEQRATSFIHDRLAHAPLGRAAGRDEVGGLSDAITAAGIGLDDAWRRFVEVVVPNAVGLDSERFLAFVPASPSAAAVWMDAMVGAATFSAESWLEAAGPVAAENAVLAWLAQLAGMPATAGGCFVSGGSLGNLSALAVARERAGGRRAVAVADTAHASVHNALHLLGLDAVVVPTGPDGRMTGAATREVLQGRTDVGVVVASGGSTNAGVVDEIAGIADVAAGARAWLHVDAAYGGAALLLDHKRPLFAGIERADSVIIDPHKWLFAPLGSCALMYRDPAAARAVHTQHGPYIDVFHTDDAWNPADFAFHLTRRAAGLPLWFSLAVHGVDAHRRAVRRGVDLAAALAAAIAASTHATLVMEPQLGVVLFERDGWDAQQWRQWATDLLEQRIAFVAPSTWRGRPVGRVVFMHPRTPDGIVGELLDSLAD